MTTDDAATIAADVLTDPARHVITIEESNDAGGDYQAIAACSCGWTSIPVPWRSMVSRDTCPVFDALKERAERMRRR